MRHRSTPAKKSCATTPKPRTSRSTPSRSTPAAIQPLRCCSIAPAPLTSSIWSRRLARPPPKEVPKKVPAPEVPFVPKSHPESPKVLPKQAPIAPAPAPDVPPVVPPKVAPSEVSKASPKEAPTPSTTGPVTPRVVAPKAAPSEVPKASPKEVPPPSTPTPVIPPVVNPKAAPAEVPKVLPKELTTTPKAVPNELPKALLPATISPTPPSQQLQKKQDEPQREAPTVAQQPDPKPRIAVPGQSMPPPSAPAPTVPPAATPQAAPQAKPNAQPAPLPEKPILLDGTPGGAVLPPAQTHRAVSLLGSGPEPWWSSTPPDRAIGSGCFECHKYFYPPSSGPLPGLPPGPPASPPTPPTTTTPLPAAPQSAVTPIAPGTPPAGGRRMEDFRNQRQQSEEGGRTIIREPDRVIILDRTVMSPALYPEIRAKSAFLDQNHSRLCAFVHGVSAG